MTGRTSFTFHVLATEDEPKQPLPTTHPGGRGGLILDDQGRLCGCFHEFRLGGPYMGFRIDGWGGHWPFWAPDLDTMMEGVKQAFRTDARDQSARVN